MTYMLVRLMIAACTAPLVAAAQLPTPAPAPANAPAAPKKPAPGTRVRERRATPELPVVPEFPDLPELRELPEWPDVAFMAQDMAMELAPVLADVQHIALGQMDFRAQELALRAQDMELRAHDMMDRLEVSHVAERVGELGIQAGQLAQNALMDVGLDIDIRTPLDLDVRAPVVAWEPDKLLRSRPREPWATNDPADSLYRLAREALNRGEYRRSAQLFNEITKKFPNSQYAHDCAYWEAFSRYRLGGTDELKQALRILDAINTEGVVRYARESSVDLPALRARIQGVLAARGDKNASESLKKEATQNDGCDREAVSVRAEALSALGQMDMQAAMPAIKKVLAKRDDCSLELRRRALYLVGRQADGEAAAIILDVAKNDTDQGIRSEAMRLLPRVAGDNAVPQLEELLRTSNDEQVQRSAVYALSSIDGDRARKSLRTIIERNDVQERIRYEAIISLSREREGHGIGAEEGNYLRSLYTKLESPRLREAVLTAVGRIETPETLQFLLGVARSETEAPSLRATAIQRLGRMSALSLNDITKLYDVADTRSLREQILWALYQRKEPDAVDKLMEIARKDTDPQIRQRAISLLARRNDPRAKELLAKLIEP